jgi:hypothetical protein
MWGLFVDHAQLNVRLLAKLGPQKIGRVHPRAGYQWLVCSHWDYRPPYEDLVMFTEFGIDCLQYEAEFPGVPRNPGLKCLFRLAVKREHHEEAARVLLFEHQRWLEKTFPTGPRFDDRATGTAAFAAARGRK